MTLHKNKQTNRKILKKQLPKNVSINKIRNSQSSWNKINLEGLKCRCLLNWFKLKVLFNLKNSVLQKSKILSKDMSVYSNVYTHTHTHTRTYTHRHKNTPTHKYVRIYV